MQAGGTLWIQLTYAHDIAREYFEWDESEGGHTGEVLGLQSQWPTIHYSARKPHKKLSELATIQRFYSKDIGIDTQS